MNIGLGNLTELKGQLLAASLRSDTNYDAVITGIGLGVANLFDQHCNRTFCRTVGKVDTFSADRRHWYLNCYPVETITALAKKDDETDGFKAYALPPDASSLIQAMQADQGYIMFISIQGYYWSRLQVTYTGGFWFDTTEDGSGVMPAGATGLPAAVKSAWYLQCQEVWKGIDKLGAQISENPEGQRSIRGMELAPMVKTLLNPFKRMQMT
ncbi:MAG: hypothetical protein ABSG78_01245 [Verrucomicrobiota bacterium]|jgi:hypothetical protein